MYRGLNETVNSTNFKSVNNFQKMDAYVLSKIQGRLCVECYRNDHNSDQLYYGIKWDDAI